MKKKTYSSLFFFFNMTCIGNVSPLRDARATTKIFVHFSHAFLTISQFFPALVSGFSRPVAVALKHEAYFTKAQSYSFAPKLDMEFGVAPDLTRQLLGSPTISYRLAYTQCSPALFSHQSCLCLGLFYQSSGQACLLLKLDFMHMLFIN